MENLNVSLSEAVCIDEEVFFGPVTEKERKIREQFENVFKNENNAVENDTSKNDSLYKSFSVDESKYESFDDSLNEGNNKTQESKHVTLRKSFDKLKLKRQGIYDSLEDVCSLASNIDRCSISHEATNDTNMNNKHLVEDSLINVPVTTANKGHGLSEQIHFDDDSLAIIEYENTFDDSLEEVNVLESIEVEEIEDIENVVVENITSKIEQNVENMPKNLFETSVQIIYEKRQNTDITDVEESSDDKNILYDSLSNSDLKDILKDSLEESEKNNENSNLSKCVSDVIVGNNSKTEDIFTNKNSFDTSVQIIYENCRNFSNFESISEKNNSDCNDISKDSLENSKNIETSVQQINMTIDSTPTGQSSKENEELVIPNSNTAEKYEYSTASNFDVNRNNKVVIDNSVEVEFMIPLTSKEILDIPKENISVDLKIQNGKLNEDKDLKSELLMEVSVGDTPSKDLNLDASVLKSLTEIDQTSVSVDGIVETSVQVSSNNTIKNPEVVHLTNEKSKSEFEKFTRLSESKASHKSLSKKSTRLSEKKLSGAKSDRSLNEKSLTQSKSKASAANSHKNLIEKSIALNESETNGSNSEKQLNKKTITVNESKTFEANSDKNMKEESIAVNVSGSRGDNSEKNSNKKSIIKETKVTEGIVEESLVEKSSTLNESKTYKGNSDENEKRTSTTLNDSVTCGGNSNKNLNLKSIIEDLSNVTLRAKSSGSQMFVYPETPVSSPEKINDVSLLKALDLHDSSLSFFNDSFIQSEDSLMPLNLCSKDLLVQHFCKPVLKKENKENIPEQSDHSGKKDACDCRKLNSGEVTSSNFPKSLQKSSNIKLNIKKTPATKIPVRKIEKFVMPVCTPSKVSKQVSNVHSHEKVKKCHHSPHSVDGGKDSDTTPSKTHHYCKVRNTIFSKVPQIVTSKKYMNIQSPVAQYIRNNQSVMRTPGFDPALRDHMNRPAESPHHSHQTPKCGSVKSGSAKKKP